MSVTAAKELFRAYDIRGKVSKDLTPDVVAHLGRTLGTHWKNQGLNDVVVARDGRDSSPTLSEKLIQGLVSTGMRVVDVGMVPTPVLYFACEHLHIGQGVMLTGSHNPPDYNGLKLVERHKALYGDAIQALHALSLGDNFLSATGCVSQKNIIEDYINAVLHRAEIKKPLNVVFDCGNGVTGPVAEALFSRLGVAYTPLFTDVDGAFPNHHPDPAKRENLEDLIRTVETKGADLGLAFDGDGDRLGVVTSSGEVIWPDRLLMLFAEDVLRRHPEAPIVFDVKSTRHLASAIEKMGGQPILWKTGHSFIKAKMREVQALLGGEMSGHFFFAEDWYGFDDGLYAAVRLLSLISGLAESPSAIFSALPNSICTPEIQIAVDEAEKFDIVERLAQQNFPGAEKITIDGVRLEYPEGWGLIRASNTTANLVLRAEADDASALERLKNILFDALRPSLMSDSLTKLRAELKLQE